MTERQKHGFDFEEWVKKTLLGGYGSRWDSPSGGPYSIKFPKWKSPIPLGSAARQYKTTRRFSLIVGFWENGHQTKRVVKILEIKISAKMWRELWGGMPYMDVALLEKAVTSVPKHCSRDALVKARRRVRELKAEIASRHPSCVITLNPKIDSKEQRRLQCSIPFKVFFEKVALASRPQKESPLIFRGKPLVGKKKPPSF
jgi:hypothetical protein